MFWVILVIFDFRITGWKKPLFLPPPFKLVKIVSASYLLFSSPQVLLLVALLSSKNWEYPSLGLLTLFVSSPLLDACASLRHKGRGISWRQIVFQRQMHLKLFWMCELSIECAWTPNLGGKRVLILALLFFLLSFSMSRNSPSLAKFFYLQRELESARSLERTCSLLLYGVRLFLVCAEPKNSRHSNLPQLMNRKINFQIV